LILSNNNNNNNNTSVSWIFQILKNLTNTWYLINIKFGIQGHVDYLFKI